jgi:hypothetical protein
MSILNAFKLAPATAAQQAFAAAVTGAGPWVPGTPATTDGLAHKVAVKNLTSNSHAGQTLTIVGTDADDKAQTESGITGPAGSATVTSSKYFKTVTSVTPSATIGADTLDIGTSNAIAGPTTWLNWKSAIGAKFFLDVTGTVNIDVDFSIADPAQFADQNAQPWVTPYASLQGETSDSSAVVAADPGYAVFRTRFNSYSAGGSAVLYASQPN